jgi:hypothetical protein
VVVQGGSISAREHVQCSSPHYGCFDYNELLEHPDPNVKVALASCLTEVTRITAPDAPYDDDVMKVRFVALLGMERWCLYVLTIAILPCCRTFLRELWILLLTWVI